jgi:cholesterol transport system auxiliary component
MKYSGVLLLPIIMISAGCGIAPKQPQPALHDFGVPYSRHESGQSAKPAVKITAPKWLWDNRIRYRLLYAAPTQVRFYALDRWIAAPPELLEQQLIGSTTSLDYLLNIRLLDFEQQFESSDRARAIMRFYLEAYSPDDKRLLGAQEFRLEQATQTADAPGAVTAFAELVQQAEDKIQAWLAKLPDAAKRNGRNNVSSAL